ncbi:MAG: hypothetical protein EOP06_13625 [Proteobacteria bacterium]|nr:MAG: hypothetical protein EOP06_13625 [Pseudomonadota bacterium]
MRCKLASSGDEVGSVLEQEHNLHIPPPLDPHIANVSLSTLSNNPAEHFDLKLTAVFGSEIVTLNSGSETIEVNLAIRKAEVILNASACHLHIREPSEAEGWVGQEDYSKSKSSQMDGSASASLGIAPLTEAVFSGEASASGSISKSSGEETNLEVSRKLRPWRLIGADLLQIGYVEGNPGPLRGKLIDENLTIRVTPVPGSESVGVLARLRVREQWIDITHARPQKTSKKLKRYWDDLTRPDSDGERRRELFSILLAHLVAAALQDGHDTKHATLAASALVFSTKKEAFSGVNGPAPRSALTIDPSAVEAFLTSEFGDEVRILRQYGIELQDESEQSDFIRAFRTIWESRARSEIERVHLRRGYPIGASDAFSSAFGLVAQVTLRELVGAADRSLFEGSSWHASVRFSRQKCVTRSAADFVKIYDDSFYGVSGLISMGVVTKGEQAYTLARLFGFTGSYAALQKKIAPYAVRTGHGNLISIFDLARCLNAVEKLEFLAGLEFDL